MNHILLIFHYFLLSKIQITLSDIYVYNSGSKLVEDYDDQPATFGPSFTNGGISAYVTLTSPKTACTKIDPPPNIPSSKYRWIALIPRTKDNDSCDFDLKVLNAQNANFSAVIIYNYEDALLPMGSHGRDVQIPATLVAFTDGLSIISNYVYNATSKNATPEYHLRITSDQFFKFGAYLIPFIVIIGLSFLSLICFMIVKCYLQRRHARRHRLPRSALKQLQTKKYVKGDRWEVCAICLDDFEEGAKLRILPCDHAYHMKCIDPWLLNNRRQCPICKRYVFPNHENSDEEDNHGHVATEQTPLIQPSPDNSTTNLSRNSQIERRIINVSGSDISNIIVSINQSSDSDDDNGDHASSSSRQTTNRRTTADFVFNEHASNTDRDSDAPLLRLASSQSSLEEIDNSTTATTITTYQSAHDSPSTSFTTTRNADFIVGSSGATTDNTNVSTHSVIEGDSDIDSDDDNDERMHSVLTDVETNQAYVPDDEARQVLRTNL